MFLVGDVVKIINQDIRGIIKECEYNYNSMDESYYLIDLGYGTFEFAQNQIELINNIC